MTSPLAQETAEYVCSASCASYVHSTLLLTLANTGNAYCNHRHCLLQPALSPLIIVHIGVQSPLLSVALISGTHFMRPAEITKSSEQACICPLPLSLHDSTSRRWWCRHEFSCQISLSVYGQNSQNSHGQKL